MPYSSIALEALIINSANDRHGELENETAAIAWLFNNRRRQMRNLARDILESRGIFEPPLVHKEGAKYVVYDGNRRVTCIKLIAKPRRAPDAELQKFFAGIKAEWTGRFPSKIMCQVETDRDRIDDILFRRHTGTQSGVGQSTWDGRMKTTFVNRTGRGGKLNLADEIEERLAAAKKLPSRKIPRSNLNRLLSAEAFRHRVGITAANGQFEYIRKEDVVLNALARIASDLATQEVTLEDVWDVESKSDYLDKLEAEGILPTAADAIPKTGKAEKSKKQKAKKPTKAVERTTLIPPVDYGVAWPGRLQRQHAIWQELQYKLELSEHPNAISVLCRVLIELSVDNYVDRAKLTSVAEVDSLARKLVQSAEALHTAGKIDKKYLQVIRKSQNMDAIISVDTLNKYVHSARLAPSPEHLTAIWDAVSELVVLCLNE